MEYKTDFRVVGIPHQGAGAVLLARTAEIGQLVTLRAEPDNEVDSEAIAVYMGETRVGYVPNRGVYCVHCYSPLNMMDSLCPRCGGGDTAAGGLASRLLHTQGLDKREGTAYVSGVTHDTKDGFLRCTILLLAS